MAGGTVTAPPVLLALCDRWGVVRTFRSTAELVAHVANIPPHLAERCSVAAYHRLDVAELATLELLSRKLGKTPAEVMRLALVLLGDQAFGVEHPWLPAPRYEPAPEEPY